jgi:hypothetical protein
MILETDNTVFFAGTASLFDDERDIASDWAGKHIKTNKYIKWVIGKYVEADNANGNGQYWTLKDLQKKHSTVDHTPMNMGHRPHDIVGTVVASEMIYPDRSDMNPYVETVAAFWKWYRPEELKALEEAYKTGNSWQSMEAVSDTVTCVGPEGCGKTFDYAGPNSDTYCACLQDRRGHKQLDNPHFLGSGLIIPPDRPGWSNADINSIARRTTDEQKHEMLASIAEAAPHLASSEWEKVMWALQLEAFSRDEVVEESKRSVSEIAQKVANQFLASSRY